MMEPGRERYVNYWMRKFIVHYGRLVKRFVEAYQCCGVVVDYHREMENGSSFVGKFPGAPRRYCLKLMF